MIGVVGQAKAPHEGGPGKTPWGLQSPMREEGDAGCHRRFFAFPLDPPSDPSPALSSGDPLGLPAPKVWQLRLDALVLPSLQTNFSPIHSLIPPLPCEHGVFVAAVSVAKASKKSAAPPRGGRMAMGIWGLSGRKAERDRALQGCRSALSRIPSGACYLRPKKPTGLGRPGNRESAERLRTGFGLLLRVLDRLPRSLISSRLRVHS